MGRSNTTARDLLSAVKTTWPLARNIYLLARDGETPELPGLRMQGATTENIEQREMIAAVMALTLTQAIVTGNNKVTVDVREITDAAQAFIASMRKMEKDERA